MVGVRELNDQDLPSLVVGQHHPPVHPRLRHDRRRPTWPPPTATRSSPWATCRRSRQRPADHRPAAVFFGLNNGGYVVANTKQPELDYQTSDGINVQNHYTGTVACSSTASPTGGVRRAARRLQPADLEPDHQGQPHHVRARRPAMGPRPRRSSPSTPTPTACWSTATSTGSRMATRPPNYPYSQNADTSRSPTGSGLTGSYNYVRNSVKVIIDAYSGKMTFYAIDPKDPVIQTYEKAFPGMFTRARRCRQSSGRTCVTPRTSSRRRPPTAATTSPAPRASTAPPTPGTSR